MNERKAKYLKMEKNKTFKYNTILFIIITKQSDKKMVQCDICHKEVDMGALISGFIVCSEECFNIAKEPNNFKYIQKAVEQGLPVL